MAPQQGGDARLQLGAEVAPPTENGELVFEAPWEARVFALAHHLCDAGLYNWDDFRDALIAEIAQWDAAEVAWIDEAVPGFKGRASRDNWVEQARELSS